MVGEKEKFRADSGQFFRNLLMLLAVMACCTPVRIFAASPESPRQCQTAISASMLQPGSFAIGSGAEWLQAKTVVVHTPGDEVF